MEQTAHQANCFYHGADSPSSKLFLSRSRQPIKQSVSVTEQTAHQANCFCHGADVHKVRNHTKFINVSLNARYPNQKTKGRRRTKPLYPLRKISHLPAPIFAKLKRGGTTSRGDFVYLISSRSVHKDGNAYPSSSPSLIHTPTSLLLHRAFRRITLIINQQMHLHLRAILSVLM